MDITTLLAQVWGPIMLALGLGFFFSRAIYIKVYRDLEKVPFAVISLGMFAMATGIFHVMAHNIWDTFPQMLVSIFGWSLLLKGAVCMVFPGFADKSGDWAVSAKIVPLSGAIALLLGLYLSWVGYLV